MNKREQNYIFLIFAVVIFAFLGIAISFGINGNFKNKLGASVSYSDFDNKVVYFDLEAFTKSLGASPEEYDYMKVAFALQGLINREKPILYYKYNSNGFPFLGVNIDEVWLSDLQSSDNMFQGKTVETYTSFYQIIDLAKNLGVVNGAVLWDNNVPATSNVASTIAGVENLVPIRYDISKQSCYTDLITNRNLFTVNRNLVGKFTGSGYLPDANLNTTTSGTASSGSKKNDAYRWAKKYYLDTKKTNSSIMGYTRDAWITQCTTGACFVDSYLPDTMTAGEEREVYITVLNNNINSNETWTKSGNYRVAAANYSTNGGGNNGFKVIAADYGFEQGNDVTSARLYFEESNPVSAGERVKLKFTIKAPDTAGTYYLNMKVVHDGYGWFNGEIKREIKVTSSTSSNRLVEHYGSYPMGIFNAGLNTSDYLIAKKAFFFDLSPDNTKAPIDDRGQSVGTDYNTLTSLLSQQKSNNNNELFTVIGFVPWFMKYTNFADSSSSLAPVAAEWKMIDIISSYNGISDADALSPVGLTNASIFTHQPLKTPFTQNNDKEAIMADKVIKEKYNSGTKYVVMYVGDYDCGAWTSGVMPSKFLLNWGSTDRYPLAWQVDSDLATRVPHAFNWMYAHQNRNDYFVGGDNGTGYLNPMKSPDLTKWKNHNIALNEQFDIDITGFLIAGNSGSVSSAVKSAYAAMTPVLVGYQASQTTANTTTGTTPFVSAFNADQARTDTSVSLGTDVYNQIFNTSNQFVIVRTVQFDRASLYSAIDEVYSKASANGKSVKFVDPYTFAQLYTDKPTSYKGCYTDGTTYQWVSGSTIPSGYTYVDTVSQSSDCHKPRTKVTKPTMTTSSYTFNGGAISPSITGFDSNTMNKTGDTSKTNIGNYSVTISLKNTDEYEWSDGTQGNISFNWSISKLTLPKPSISGTSTFTYNGSAQGVTVSNINTTWMTETGDKSKTNAGSYQVKYALKDKTNTSWSDGTTTDVTLNWSISKLTLPKPTINGDSTFTYDGTSKGITLKDFNSTYMNKTGTESSVNAGNYTVTISLKNTNNLVWSGNTSSDVTLNWSISKVKVEKPTISGSDSFTYNGNYQSLTFENLDTNLETVTGNEEIDVSSYTTTVSLNDTTNYSWSDDSISAILFTWSITKANLDAEVSISDYYENKTPSTPVVTGNLGNGEVTYSYTVRGEDNYKSSAPRTKGEYTIKAIISSTNNYNAQTVTSNFNVLESADDAITLPDGSIITDVGLYGELIDSYNKEKGTSFDYTHLFTESELASLKTLVISKENYHKVEVKDLSNLSYLTNLENLIIDFWEGCETQKLDLRKNTKLKNLSIKNANINVINISKLKLSNIDLDKTNSIGYILLDKKTDVSYLINSSSQEEDNVKNNSFNIICDKYNLTIGEETNCTIKGKTSELMSVLIFKLNQDNENISISNIRKVATNLNGDKEFIYFGNIPTNEEFDIITFKVTAISRGSSSINLIDYDEENRLGYIKASDDKPVQITDNISKTFYIDKYAMIDQTGNFVTEGNMETNYTLHIVSSDGSYIEAYKISVLGDVFADGKVNAQDVGRAYITTATSNYSELTTAEMYALDYNFDGYYNLLDVNQIYNLIQ